MTKFFGERKELDPKFTECRVLLKKNVDDRQMFREIVQGFPTMRKEIV